MKRITDYLPRSLFGRNLLLIVTLILVAELGISVLFRQMVQEPRTARMIDVAQLHVEALHAALLTMAPAQRSAYLAQLDRYDTNHIAASRITGLGQTPVPFVDPDYRLVSLFMQRLHERMGQRYRLGWQETPEQRLWIGTQIDSSDYWLGINAGVFVGNMTSLFLAVALGAGMLALLGAYLIQRRLNRPLQMLAAAAMHIGHGQVGPLQLDHAPIEIAQLGASFNQMAIELERAENERVLMLAGVSHDLRTPLAKLRLAAEILSENGEQEIIDGMIRNIADADAIIGQFIDFARVGNDEISGLCDINELANDIAKASDRSLVTLELGMLPPYRCRPLALRRAIVNLVENALRHGRPPDDGRAILLRTAILENTLLISVSDHGCGIPPEEMARLRQPFARLDQARSGKTGAGLGLAIVERIARLHQGDLRLANRPHGGLEATLILPLHA